jgi:pimeloyl-ACP methyl ester carboxylesterase
MKLSSLRTPWKWRQGGRYSLDNQLEMTHVELLLLLCKDWDLYGPGGGRDDITEHTPARAAVGTWPSGFHGQQMAVSGGTQYVRIGGHGPAVLLLHGFGDTGDMWTPLAEILVKDHTVIVPDLRGMGLSSHQDGGYEKTAQARDLALILDKLGVQNLALVTHDIGNMVGYAFAALYPERVDRWVVMDAPLPGIGHWDDQLKNPKVWHFNFRGPDVERLVAGRERILLGNAGQHRRADAQSLRRVVRPARRNSRCLQRTVCGVCPGRDR